MVLERSPDLSGVIRTKAVYHRCLCKAMGLPWEGIIWQVRNFGHDLANDELVRPLQGDQGPASVPQVPLQGHVVSLGRCNLASKDFWQ